MKSSIAEFVDRQLARELLPTDICLWSHAACLAWLRILGVGKHEKAWF